MARPTSSRVTALLLPALPAALLPLPPVQSAGDATAWLRLAIGRAAAAACLGARRTCICPHTCCCTRDRLAANCWQLRCRPPSSSCQGCGCGRCCPAAADAARRSACAPLLTAITRNTGYLQRTAASLSGLQGVTGRARFESLKLWQLGLAGRGQLESKSKCKGDRVAAVSDGRH